MRIKIFDNRRLRAKVQEMTAKTEKLENRIAEYKHVQELLVKDILTLQEVAAAYKGNEYPDYSKAVTAISDKYNSKADWGCIQTGTIVDLRAAFILGEGVQVVHTTETRAEAERELQWVEDFFSWNDLDAEMAQELAKEAEIEGKIAIKIIYEEEQWREWPGMISARYISWISKRYNVITDPQDYLYYKNLEWQPTEQVGKESLDENIFVYKKFGGRLNAPNEAQPKIMKCLTQIDNLDRALRDLRQINHLYAAPTPNFEVEDPKQVDSFMGKLEKINWKIGKILVHTGKFDLKGVDPAGVQNLIAEIELLTKMISGTTGIPIHFLGLLDLLKNRATGDNTRELVMAATSREREIWKGAYEELITKAMNLFNEKIYAQKSEGSKLDPTKIRVEIPLITQEHWDRIEKVLIPAAMAGIVSKEYVAGQIPGVDMEEEAERKVKKDAEEEKRAKQEMELLKAQMAGGNYGVE